jgi:hypothetical protein
MTVVAMTVVADGGEDSSSDTDSLDKLIVAGGLKKHNEESDEETGEPTLDSFATQPPMSKQRVHYWVRSTDCLFPS